jgi:hypothetical protein
MPRGPSAPEPSCPRCSKPVTPDTASQRQGRAIHTRCLAPAAQLEAIEQQDGASRTPIRPEALVQRVSELAAQARAKPWLCPVCEQRLTTGGRLLFQGDVLVHATCWREPRPLGRA